MAVIRFQYTKGERLKYIAHLDTLRTFIRALRRAKLPIAYSQGFNPHPIISFLMPLSLGFTSNCEMVDIGFAEEISCEEAAKRLDAALPPGFDVTGAAPPVHKPAEITQAEYSVTFRGQTPSDQQIEAFFGQQELIVDKKSKRGVKQVDIMPMIHSYAYRQNVLTLRLSAGSEQNLNPELVMTHFCQDSAPWDYQICREHIYCGSQLFS
ncbi:MAG: TIGR03936 family radical SAM-associated protein [Clostridia bacterium]|nr:TIGR03936 family radical SAM-associated protein [Clostridia bacterium]